VSIGLALPAQAGVQVIPEANVTVTATDNGGLEPDSQAKSDTIIDITARLRMLGRGAGYQLDVNLAADALEYVERTAPNRVLPSGYASLVATLLDRWLYLDTSMQVEQTMSNAFGVLSDTGSSANRLTTARYAVAPYLSHEFSPTLSLLARTERRWVKRYAVDTAGGLVSPNAREANDSIRITEVPQPFGYSLEYTGHRVNFEGDVPTELSTQAARGTLSYAIDPVTASAALVVGRERNEFSLSRHTDPIYGVRFKWTPSERTTLAAEVERRFFGNGWDVELAHRSPFVALALHGVRRPTDLSSSRLLGGEGTTAGLIDAMLSTRYPDPATRAPLVQQLINQLGLPPQLRGPVELFSDAPQLDQALDLTAAVRGRLTTVTMGVYTRKLLRLSRTDDPLSTLLDDDTGTRQNGVSVAVNRRLDPLTSLTLLATHSRIQGMGLHAADRTIQTRYGFSATRQLSPSTTFNAGLRRQFMRTTVVSDGTMHESALFVGLNHRF
jgi:uncharacterized protein (PEP-CTERM system associated)